MQTPGKAALRDWPLTDLEEMATMLPAISAMRACMAGSLATGLLLMLGPSRMGWPLMLCSSPAASKVAVMLPRYLRRGATAC